MEDSPQKIRHKEDSPHNECDREFERKRPTNVRNSADVEDSPHNGDTLGSGGGVGSGGLGGLRLGSWVGPGGRRVGVGGGSGSGFPTPPAQPLDFNPPNPNPPNPTPPTSTYYHCQIVWRIFHISTVANVCMMLTLKFSVTFVRLTCCVANLLCGESSMCESSGNRLDQTT